MTLWPLHAHAKGRDDISTSNGQPATQKFDRDSQEMHS